jgi:hypothetical protein
MAESNPQLNSVGYHYPGKGTTRSRSQSLGKRRFRQCLLGTFPKLLPNNTRLRQAPAGLVRISSSHLIHCHTGLVALTERRCTPAGTCWACWDRTLPVGHSRPAEPAARAEQTGTRAGVGAKVVAGRGLAPERRVRARRTRVCACAAAERPREVRCR